MSLAELKFELESLRTRQRQLEREIGAIQDMETNAAILENAKQRIAKIKDRLNKPFNGYRAAFEVTITIDEDTDKRTPAPQVWSNWFDYPIGYSSTLDAMACSSNIQVTVKSTEKTPSSEYLEDLIADSIDIDSVELDRLATEGMPDAKLNDEIHDIRHMILTTCMNKFGQYDMDQYRERLKELGL